MTENFNPIVGKEESSILSVFKPRPAPGPGIALVLFKEGQPLVLVGPGDQLTAGEVVWGKYKTIYRVDITEHSFSFTCSIPCQGDAFDFHADCHVNYKAHDPRAVVQQNVTDARAVLEPVIVEKMRRDSRNFDVEQVALAESTISKRTLADVYVHGLMLTGLVLKLTLDESARSHTRKLREIARTKELEERDAELQLRRSELEIERMRMKTDFYSGIIRQGQWQLLAMQLANNPGDVAAVTEMLRTQHQIEIDNQLRALKILLEEDALEGFQIEKVGKRLLQQLVRNFGVQVDVKSLPSGDDQKAITPKRKKKRPEPQIDDEQDIPDVDGE